MAEVKAAKPTVDREKTCPFLLRTFVKTGGFHTLDLFEDGTFPTTDEHNLYTWNDATLKELVTLLRSSTPSAFRHPLARFSFRLIFTDPARGGRYGSKDLGVIHARDLIDTNALTIAEHDEEPEYLNGWSEDRTLEELRFQPGDFIAIAVMLPYTARNPVAPAGPGFSMRGMAARGAAPGRGGASGPPGRGTDASWAGRGGMGRGAPGDEPAGGGHWRGRGGSLGLPPGGLGRMAAGRGGGRDGDDDRRGGGGPRRGGGADRDAGGDRDNGYPRRAPLPRRERDVDDDDVKDEDDRGEPRERDRDRSRRRRSYTRSRSPVPRRDRDKDRGGRW